MTHRPTIPIGSDEIKQAMKHGMELWWDGSTPTKRLDQRNDRDGFTRFVNARIEGKIGEEAFSQFLEQAYGIESQVDYRIYGDYETTDHGDLQYLVGDAGSQYAPQSEFDVKKSKPWNQWLAIRTEIFDRHPSNAPFVLTRLSIPDDIKLDEWADADDWETVRQSDVLWGRFGQFVDDHRPVWVELTGTAYPDEFTDTFEAGDRLYDPSTGDDLGPELRRDNRGIHVDDLVATKARWNRVVSEIVGDNPISYTEL